MKIWVVTAIRKLQQPDGRGLMRSRPEVPPFQWRIAQFETAQEVEAYVRQTWKIEDFDVTIELLPEPLEKGAAAKAVGR